MAKPVKGDYAIPIDDSDFMSGSLRQPGNIRPNRLFTADNNIILYQIGSLNKEKLAQVIEKLIGILRS